MFVLIYHDTNLLHGQRIVAKGIVHQQGEARLTRNAEGSPSPLSVHFTVVPVQSDTCYGGNTGLGSTALRLEYRNNASKFEWLQVADGIPVSAGVFNATISGGSGCVEFRLVQEEHGGGYCNCWFVRDIRVNDAAVHLQESPG